MLLNAIHFSFASTDLLIIFGDDKNQFTVDVWYLFVKSK